MSAVAHCINMQPRCSLRMKTVLLLSNHRMKLLHKTITYLLGTGTVKVKFAAL